MTTFATIPERSGLRLEALPHRPLRRRVQAGADPARREETWRSTPPGDPDPGAGPLPRNLVDVNVLVVDDDASTLEFLAVALAHCGARVTTASGAGDALAVLSRACPDIVLSDIAMPGQDGYWLLREIRRHVDPAVSAVPVVATTAYGREHSQTRTRAAGFAAHLAKPIDPDDLCRAIAALMRR